MKKNLYVLLFFMIQIQSMAIFANNETDALMTYLYQNLETNKQKIPSAKNALKKTIIFDLDGVLCKTNDLQAFYEIGMIVICQYMIKHGKPCQKELFKALNDAPAITRQSAYNDGLRIPQIMIDWQTNAQELYDIQDCMVQHICNLQNLTIEQKNLHINTVLMMTNPEKFIATRQLIQEAVQLLYTLKKQGYRLYILSNWDALSFPLFIKNFPDLFSYEGKDMFDGIMISGKVGMVKPQSEIFEKCLQKFNIDATDAIFIDDTAENIQQAQELGITSILCKNKDIANVINELIKNTYSNTL